MPPVEDVAWKYVDRLEGKEKKWRCRYCGKKYNGSIKRVKAHLGRVENKGIKPCPHVPDDVRDEMRSLLEAEEGSRQSSHQSSTERLLHDMSMPRQAVHQDVLLIQPSLELGGPRLPMPRVEADPANFTYQLISNQQLQGEHQFPITPSLAQNKQVASSSSQTVFQRHSALNPNDTENWNPPGCTQKFLSFYGQTGIAAASVCPQDQVSLHPGNMLSEAQAGVAEVQLPPRRMMDSNDRDVFEERIQGNVGAAPTSTSHLPNVEGGNNLESPQGVLLLSPHTSMMDEMLSKGRGCTTNYNSEFSLSNSVCYNDFEPSIGQQNPHIPLPSQDPRLLHSTFQHELQEFIPHAPIALDTGLSNIATTSTPQRSSQPLQSDSQCVHGAALFSPRDYMDIESPIPSQPLNGLRNVEPPDSRQQIPSYIMNTMGPSTSEGMLNCAPARASLYHYDRTTVLHSNEPLPSCNEDCSNEAVSSSLRESMDIYPPTATLVHPASSQDCIVSEVRGPLMGASSFHEDNSECFLDCNRPHVSSGTDTIPHSNEPLPSCSEEHGAETNLFPLRESVDIARPTKLRPMRGPHFSETTTVDLQVVEGVVNMVSLSSLQASVPPQDQIIPHQSINNKTSDAQQNTTVPSSSCNIHLVPCLPPAPLDMDPYISSSSQVPNDAPPSPYIPPSRAGRISSLPDMNEGAPTASHANKGDNFEENRALKRKLEELCSRVAGIRDELDFAASLSVENKRREVENWLPDVEKFIEDYTGAASKGCLPPHEVNKLKRKSEDLLRQGNFPKGLFEARETKVSKFLEGKMVGEAFKRNTTKILEYLVGNQVSRLGIYGMGGVGKTTIMKHIHNRLLEEANYGNVLWITVSKDFNTKKLQNDIWEELGLGKLKKKDVRKRAAMLHDRLTKRGKCTLILDDVWEDFDLEEVGIPIRADGFQLALTTRSFYVCRQMRCQEIIKIEPLSPKEAESLFLEELGSEVVLSLEIKPVVESVVEECAGLPLGVITIARSMRGVNQLFMWTDLLVKLKESSMGQTDMENKVLMSLKFSYDRLGNPDVQQCFLSCALYPEDELIGKLELIELFIDQGLIGELDTRKQQYDRCLTILSILENVCLLEDHEEKMKMHDLIRDMALHIIGATSMVKAGKWLERIPYEECWTDALQRVSLMMTHFREFPLNMSPNCPKLSTLLLNNSLWQGSVIPDSFFQKLRGLEVLNLSWCERLTELPNSISDLVNLRALLLGGCFELRHIPSVAKLTSLRKLDAKGCTNLEEIEGLEMLVSLRYLDLSDTKIKSLPKETFRRLLKLQYLKVRAPIEEDITYLGALETLECCFGDANDFNKCVRVIGQRNDGRYDLTVNPFKSFYLMAKSDDDEDPIFKLDKIIAIEEWSDAIVSVGGECAGNFILIPRDVQKLTMRNCGGITNLAGMDPLKCLEELFIEDDLRVLCGGQDEEGIDIRDSPATIPSPPLFPSLRRLEISFCLEKYLFGYGSNFPLPHLREIHISHCGEMEGIMATVASPPPCPNPAFPSLEKIVVSCCDKMKRVVESEWLPHFPNLREIAVEFCENMEEIIGGPPPNMTVGEIPLESLEVKRCDEMRMLFTHEWLIHLRNLQRIRVDRCGGMVEMISSGAGQSQEGSTRSEAGQSQGGSIMTPVTDTSSRSSISLPKLTHLQLCNLPRLQSICEVSVTCDSIEYIMVGKCPELKGIPLLLRLRDIEDLPYIWVDNEEMWNMLTWNQPNTQAILQSYLRKGEEANIGFEMWKFIMRSPTAIELPGKGKAPEWRFW